MARRPAPCDRKLAGASVFSLTWIVVGQEISVPRASDAASRRSDAILLHNKVLIPVFHRSPLAVAEGDRPRRYGMSHPLIPNLQPARTLTHINGGMARLVASLIKRGDYSALSRLQPRPFHPNLRAFFPRRGSTQIRTALFYVRNALAKISTVGIGRDLSLERFVVCADVRRSLSWL